MSAVPVATASTSSVSPHRKAASYTLPQALELERLIDTPIQNVLKTNASRDWPVFSGRNHWFQV